MYLLCNESRQDFIRPRQTELNEKASAAGNGGLAILPATVVTKRLFRDSYFISECPVKRGWVPTSGRTHGDLSRPCRRRLPAW